jgi:hypothetical protein
VNIGRKMVAEKSRGCVGVLLTCYPTSPPQMIRDRGAGVLRMNEGLGIGERGKTQKRNQSQCSLLC